MRSMSAALWILCAGAASAQAPIEAATPLADEPALELLGGPDGDPPQAGAASIAPVAAANPVVATLAAPAPAEPPERARPRPALGVNGPAGAVGVSMGMGLCWQAQGAARGTNAEPPSALVLGMCDGRDAQRVRLQDGALIADAAGGRRVRPLEAPARGCRTQTAQTATRVYEFRLCAGAGDLAMEELAPGRMRITAYAEPGAPAYVRGAPLMVEVAASGGQGALRFEYVRRGKLLRLAGTDLCVAPPAGDVSDQAPLYLESCAAPSGSDRAHLRATFVMSWR